MYYLDNHTKTARVLLFVFFWLSVLSLSAQESRFLFTYTDEDHSWFAKDAIETASGDFIIGAQNDWGSESLLLKLSPDGTILSETPIMATDTNVLLCRLFRSPNEQKGGYMAFCPCKPSDHSQAAILFVWFDEALEITFCKAIKCPFMEAGDSFADVKFLTLASSIVATFTIRQNDVPIGPTFLAQISNEYEFVSCQRLDSISTVCNLFLAEDDKIGLFYSKLNSSHMGILTFDKTLQLIDRAIISTWTVPEGSNGDFFHYTIFDMMNSQAAMLPNGSYLVSAKLHENLFHTNGYPYKDDRSVVLAKYENDFHQPENMIVMEHMNDSIEFPSFYRSMDFRETDEVTGCDVYQCSILNELPQWGLFQPYPTGIVVTKTDQDLNLIWKKRFLTDKNYQPTIINATADGGCLVVGSIGDYQTQRFDVFALKINADGSVGTKETIVEDICPYACWPNPANDVLHLHFSPDVQPAQAELYDLQGRLVRTWRNGMERISLQGLAPGTYTMRVALEDGTVFTDKVVKE